MPKIIDHDKRKEEILYTALEVFSREGYKERSFPEKDIRMPTCHLSPRSAISHDPQYISIFTIRKKFTTMR